MNLSIGIVMKLWLSNVEDLMELMDLQSLGLQPKVILILVMMVLVSIFINIILVILHLVSHFIRRIKTYNGFKSHCNFNKKQKCPFYTLTK